MPNYILSIVVDGKDNASGALGRVSSSLGGLGKIAGGIIGVGALYAIGNQIVSLGKDALSATADWERLGATITTLAARELRNADATLTMEQALTKASGESKELMGWIQKLAILSPFDSASVGLAFRQAMTYGFTADEAQKLTQVLVDMSAGMGLSADQMGSVSYALGQIKQADRLLMQDLRQLTSAGVPVNDILKKMGYTMSDVGKEAISTTEFLAAFNETMGDDFEGAAKKQSTSWAGLLNSMSDIKKIGLREFFSSTFSEIQPLLEDFVTKMTDPAIQEQIRKWGEPLGAFTKKLIDLVTKMRSGDFDIGVMLLGWSEKFKNWSKNMDWAGMSDDIIAGLDNIDWAAAGVKVEDFASDMFSGIGVAVKEIKWGEIAASFSTGWSEFVTSALMGQPITFEQLFGGFDNVETDIVSFGARLRISLMKLQGDVEAAVMLAFSNAMPSISKAINAWNEPITVDLEGIKKLFFNHFMGMGIQAILGLDNIKPSLLKKIGEFFVSVMEAIKPIMISIGVTLPNFAALLAEIEEFVAAANAAMGGFKGGKSRRPGGGSSSYQGPVETASRGLDNFVVPPGYPNDSYPIMVQSGEQVNVSQPGTYRNGNKGGGGDTYINVSIAVDKLASALDIRQLAYQVANEIQARRA